MINDTDTHEGIPWLTEHVQFGLCTSTELDGTGQVGGPPGFKELAFGRRQRAPAPPGSSATCLPFDITNQKADTSLHFN